MIHDISLNCNLYERNANNIINNDFGYLMVKIYFHFYLKTIDGRHAWYHPKKFCNIWQYKCNVPHISQIKFS